MIGLFFEFGHKRLKWSGIDKVYLLQYMNNQSRLIVIFKIIEHNLIFNKLLQRFKGTMVQNQYIFGFIILF